MKSRNTNSRRKTIFILAGLTVCLLMSFAAAAAQYDYQNWVGWYDNWDSWGETPYYENNSYGYDWFGQDQSGTGIGSADYVPAPTAPEQLDNWGAGDWNNNSWNSPSWTSDGLYDDFNDYGTEIIPEIDYGSSYGSLDDFFGPIPGSMEISQFTGHAQSTNLDCETRSAVDLAAYFGVYIDHDEFLARLPRSDDPNEGFVGDPNGARGQLPPASYGVYEQPVAELLREYGLNAIGMNGMSVEELKSQIAKGHPVMVWVAGSTEVGYPVTYVPSNGRITEVVPYQHTVVVIGFDSGNVLVQDGANRYSRTWGTFEASWATLNNRAIFVSR